MVGITPITPSKIYISPNYNAVKIDINNPEVTQQEPQQAQNPNYSAPIYAYPQQQIYNVPTKSIYTPPSVQEDKAVETKTLPQPVITTTPIVPKPVVIDNKVNESIEPKQVVEVKKAEELSSKVDVNAIISKLNDSNFDVQAKTMAEIAKTVNTNPKEATQFLDVKVIDTLLGIMTKDTSNLSGPTAEQLQARAKLISGQQTTPQEQALAKTTTPMELAEVNKQYSLYTVAILQKLYASEIEKTSNNIIPLTELPGAAATVEQLKDNANPMVRVASIEALSYIEKPEYKKDLTTLFSVAKNDQDEVVRKAASLALEKLAKVADETPQINKTETAVSEQTKTQA